MISAPCRSAAVALLLAGLAALLLPGCSRDEDEVVVGADFESWYPKYNAYIVRWLGENAEALEKEIAELEASGGEGVEEVLADKRRALERFQRRLDRGDYFQFKTSADLPAGLAWQDGGDEPEIGDPEAKKGGIFRYWIQSFPPTIRPFGPNSNNSFRSELYDSIEIALVDLHPETGELIPGLAKEWAVSEDKRTVYFRLRPGAAYNDGVEVQAIDFMWWFYLRASDNVVSPWFKQYIREQFAGVTTYGEDVVAVTLPDARPKVAYFANIPPSPPHFYAEYGPDYKERYQWRVPPTTAAYTVREGDLEKGASITLTRVEDWWARDLKFYRYRFNVDKIRYTVVRDINKAWELFRAGEIDYFPVSLPEFWYERSEMPPVYKGYVERYTWYNQYPRIPWALYLNMAKPPLDNRDVRLGLSHATNWQKVIDVVFRGDAERLPGWTKGFGAIDNPEIEARPFSVTKAREYFAKAGYRTEGADGILRNDRGERLEVILTYGKSAVRDRMLVILKEEARKAGLDLILDGLDPTLAFTKAAKKEHQAEFSAWGFQPPYPRYYEYFHSRNAYDEKGNLKQNTNNVFSFADPRMDELALAYRNATSEEELVEYAHEMQEIIHDAAVFVPGYMSEFARVACWRWVRWPDSEFTEFAPPRVYVPLESYVYWVDQEMKRETLEAMRKGRTFPEVQAEMDRYRVSEEGKGEGNE